VPLYEIVLRFPDRDEIRLTDQNDYRTGEEIQIAERSYLVTGTEPPAALRAEARFVLEPCDERPDRAPVAQASPPSA
jgi:hypothetical protein